MRLVSAAPRRRDGRGRESHIGSDSFDPASPDRLHHPHTISPARPQETIIIGRLKLVIMAGDRWGVRILLILLLMGLQIGLFLHYGRNARQCPENTACLATDYDRYVGETVREGGTVVSTSPPTIAIPYAPGERLELRLTNLPFPVRRGDSVSVYGELRPDRTVAVRDAARHPVRNLYYMYAISALAVVGTIALGLRHWRLDPNTLTVKRRDA